MRILTASDGALLVEAADLDEAMRLHIAFESIPGVIELVPAARTVLVRFDSRQVTAAVLAEQLRAVTMPETSLPQRGTVTIPVHYDGDDLEAVATLLGVSTQEVIARHLTAAWRVAFSGFAPGFGYLIGTDPLFDVPRRSSPRTRVPAGSVGLAGPFTGVYPRASPGGWQLIGRTDAAMWDIHRDPPALLVPGASVRFVRAERVSVAAASAVRPAAVASAFALEVVQPSLQLLVQDLGRPGLAALGVSASGVADRTALRSANRAVGNQADAAVLECLGGGAVLRMHGANVAAVAGAVGPLTVTGPGGIVRGVAHGEPFAVADGDELSLGAPEQGLRYVLAVRGGVSADAELGSQASDTLAGLGPAPLHQGDIVPLADPRRAPHAVWPGALPRPLPAVGEVVELEVTLGPRDDWFTAQALEVLLGQEWQVTQRADRVGIRLHGEVPLERAIAGELPSEGAVTGAIQVPPDGQPVLFLPDHPLTGGYPIIGAVTDRFLDLAAQLPPGCRVRFVVENSPGS